MSCSHFIPFICVCGVTLARISEQLVAAPLYAVILYAQDCVYLISLAPAALSLYGGCIVVIRIVWEQRAGRCFGS